jgi:hypothetical protein
VVNDTVCSNQAKIRECIMSFYDSFFTEGFSCQPRLDGLTFNSIGEDEAIWLERAFKEDEVFEVVKDLNGDKAPSLLG